MTKNYINWKIEKEKLNYIGQDEELQKQAEEAQNEYTNVANWCNEGQEYHIEDTGEYYEVVKNQEPTHEELIQREIQQLKQYLAQTDYVVVKIAEGEEPTAHTLELISERKRARARINELEAELEV